MGTPSTGARVCRATHTCARDVSPAPLSGSVRWARASGDHSSAARRWHRCRFVRLMPSGPWRPQRRFPPRPCTGPRVCLPSTARGRSPLVIRGWGPRGCSRTCGPACPGGRHRACGTTGRPQTRGNGMPPSAWCPSGARSIPRSRASSPTTASGRRRPRSRPGTRTVCPPSWGATQALRPRWASRGRRRSTPGAGAMRNGTTAPQGWASGGACSMLAPAMPRTRRGGAMVSRPGRGARTRANPAAGAPTCG